MQEALTIAGWLAVGVFVLAALADGRGYRMVRGLLAALVWTIDTVRDLKARYQARKVQHTAEGARTRDTAGDSPAHSDAASRTKGSTTARLSNARRRVTSAASTRKTGASTRAGDTPTPSTGSD